MRIKFWQMANKSSGEMDQLNKQYLDAKIRMLEAKLGVIKSLDYAGAMDSYINRIKEHLSRIPCLESQRDRLTEFTCASSISHYITPFDQLDGGVNELRGKLYRLPDAERKEWESTLSRIFPVTSETEKGARAALYGLSMAIYESGLRYTRQMAGKSNAVASLIRRVIWVFVVLVSTAVLINTLPTLGGNYKAVTDAIRGAGIEMILWGALGGAVSSLIQIRSRKISTTTIKTVKEEAIIRTVIGGVAGLVMFFLLNGRLIEFPFLRGAEDYPWDTYKVMGFVAGFSERFVFGAIGGLGRGRSESESGPKEGR